ncbi:monovalent cation/H+ antiporter subunit D family protein [Candidatus Poribacteria bacterium]|nr:monovalent cation/H+ antiporter subunit D family protein [Candidatus Poribacteria bacterium]
MQNLFSILNKNIISHFIILVILLPIAGGIISFTTGFILRKYHKIIAIVSLILTLSISVILAMYVLYYGKLAYIPGNWDMPWKIEFLIDYLNAPLVAIIPGLSLIIIFYSLKYIPIAITNQGRSILYYPLFLLIVGAMEGFILANDLFTMFMFLSTFSLSGYTLVVAGGDKKSVIAGMKYLFMGAIASVFFLHGIAFIYAAFGTMNMQELSAHLKNWNGDIITAVGLILLIIGFSLKSALFPIHTWLPDAHTYAPSSVSAILSGLVVEMGAFGIIRVIYTIYGFKNIEMNFSLGNILLIFSTFAIILGALGAIFQDNLKTILAYSSISQMGYIIMGIGLGSYYGVVGSLLHIINHAIMKAALFLCAGSFIYQTGTHSLKKLQGIGKKMPGTIGAFMVAGISIIGFPPTSGFMSKWYLCLGAIEAKKPFFAIVILLGSILSAIYYIKIFNQLYFKPYAVEKDLNYEKIPKSMVFSVWVLAILCVLLGLVADIPLLWIKPAVMQMI